MNSKSTKDLMVRPDPSEDGKSHINTHSQGKTELGRQLAHYYHLSFLHPYYGPFWCVEGFIHYLRGGGVDDAYRRMVGHQVKRRTDKMKAKGLYIDKPLRNLSNIILAANHAKIDQNPTLKALLTESTLPFEHYFLFGAGHVIVRPKGAHFLIEDFTYLRTLFQEGMQFVPPDYSSIYK